MKKEECNKCKKCWGTILVIVLVSFCCFFIYGRIKYYQTISSEVKELQQDVEWLKTSYGLMKNAETQPTELEKAIAFLENETVKYREFIKDQQSFGIWLIGFIGAALTGLFAFFEIRGGKDISNIIEEKYKNQVEVKMEELVGGEGRIEYLSDCTEREKKAKDKKILFVFQKEENENLMWAYHNLEAKGMLVEKRNVGNEIADAQIKRWTKQHDIIVYQVGKSEDSKENPAYKRISEECQSEKKYGILYCENRLDHKNNNYINIANYGLTVMERIFNLLYFV